MTIPANILSLPDPVIGHCLTFLDLQTVLTKVSRLDKRFLHITCSGSLRRQLVLYKFALGFSKYSRSQYLQELQELREELSMEYLNAVSRYSSARQESDNEEDLGGDVWASLVLLPDEAWQAPSFPLCPRALSDDVLDASDVLDWTDSITMAIDRLQKGKKLHLLIDHGQRYEDPRKSAYESLGKARLEHLQRCFVLKIHSVEFAVPLFAETKHRLLWEPKHSYVERNHRLFTKPGKHCAKYGFRDYRRADAIPSQAVYSDSRTGGMCSWQYISPGENVHLVIKISGTAINPLDHPVFLRVPADFEHHLHSFLYTLLSTPLYPPLDPSLDCCTAERESQNRVVRDWALLHHDLPHYYDLSHFEDGEVYPFGFGDHFSSRLVFDTSGAASDIGLFDLIRSCCNPPLCKQLKSSMEPAVNYD